VRNAQKPDHASLVTLIGWLKEGRFVIPDFQRDFEWMPWDISDLMRSIFLDYYIGSLLLWKGTESNFDALACEPIYGYEGTGTREHIVLDGQQRLTAMYYAFTAPDEPAPNRANRYLYFIRVDRFMDEAYDDAFKYDWTRTALKLAADTNRQYEQHMFPMAVMGDGGWALANWVQGYEKHWQQQAEAARDVEDSETEDAAQRHAERAREFGEQLKSTTEQYQVAYIELDRELELEKVCDIFTQINSKGIRLDVFDLVNALLKPRGLQLKHMWRKAKPALDFVESDRLNVYVLQVMSILRQAYCSPKYLYYLLPGQEKLVRESDGSLRKEILVQNTDDFSTLWDTAVNAMGAAIEHLRHPHEFGVTSSQYLPYISILPAFTALRVTAGELPPNQQLDAGRKIRHWYWASVFTNRYSGSVESTAARDYLDVKDWFDNDDAQPGLIAEFKTRFRSLELRKELRRGSSVYNGIFNLLVLRGARDWMTGNVPQYGELDDHHIVPKDWGKSQESVGGLIDSILNRTPLTANTNRNVISNRLPNAYLPELIAANDETTVRAILDSHFISPHAFDVLLRDPFTPTDFEEFLSERQKTIQEAIETLLIKERLDLDPILRELDEKVEEVELAMRGLIATSLDDDGSQLPPHVKAKVDERVRTGMRKNPAMDLDRYETLTGMLEFCDLRELQDIIGNKALWPLFESSFATRELLAGKFGQLAELRNGLAHNRTVDGVTRKEGEAAILWFEQVLQASAAAA
jgi:hypothetical protein